MTSRSDGIKTGESAGAGGRAGGASGVGVIEDDALAREAVEDGGFEEAVAGVSQLIKALLVCHDEDDVGAFGWSRHGHERDSFLTRGLRPVWPAPPKRYIWRAGEAKSGFPCSFFS